MHVHISSLRLQYKIKISIVIIHNIYDISIFINLIMKS